MTPARADQLAAPLRECPWLFSLSARRAAASQDPPLRSVGVFGASPQALLPASWDLDIGGDLPYSFLAGSTMDT